MVLDSHAKCIKQNCQENSLLKVFVLHQSFDESLQVGQAVDGAFSAFRSYCLKSSSVPLLVHYTIFLC